MTATTFATRSAAPLRRRLAVAAIAALAFGGSVLASPGALGTGQEPSQTSSETAVVQAFEQRIADYVRLHRILEGPLPPLQVSQDLRVVRAAMDALARRIQEARRQARRGDLFSDDVTLILRRRIAACLSPEDVEAILAEHETGDPVEPPRLEVNAVWPEDFPYNFVPPSLIATLPPLPPELQYRIIGRSLVLWDYHANLIVDIMPGAFTT